jgi:hypothetical protein
LTGKIEKTYHHTFALSHPKATSPRKAFPYFD